MPLPGQQARGAAFKAGTIGTVTSLFKQDKRKRSYDSKSQYDLFYFTSLRKIRAADLYKIFSFLETWKIRHIVFCDNA